MMMFALAYPLALVLLSCQSAAFRADFRTLSEGRSTFELWAHGQLAKDKTDVPACCTR